MSHYKISLCALLIALSIILSCGCNADNDALTTTAPSTTAPAASTDVTIDPTIDETIPADYQVFALDGITLTLPKEFEEVPDQQSPLFYSGYSVVMVVREPFTVHASLADMSLDEYCAAFIASRNMDATVRVQGGLHWFDYNTDVPDNEVQYNRFVVVYKTATDFWLVEFTCDSRVAVRLRPFFFDWAKMIAFTD